MQNLKGSYREIWNISYPLILGQVAWTAVGVTDTAFLGHYSQVALAAGGYAGMFYLLLLMMGFGLTRGTQILIARCMGEGKPKEAGRIFDNTVVTLIAASLVFMLLVWALGDRFFHLILKDEAVADGCVVFTHYRIPGLLASYLSSIFVAFYSGIGRTGILMYSIGIMSVLNILLNKALIFGQYGFPELGIAGSAISSTISEYVSVLILAIGSLFKNRQRDFGLYRFQHFDFSLTKVLLHTGAPLILQSLIGLGGWFLFFAFVEKMGQDALAISNIMRQVFMFIGIAVYSLGSTTNTIVSNLYGQQKMEGIKTAVHRLILFSFAATAIWCFLSFVFPEVIIGFFTPDEKLVTAGLPVLYVVLVALLVMSVCNVYFNALISMGSTVSAVVIEGVAMAVYILYFLLLFSMQVSLARLWTAEWIYWLVILLMTLRYLRKRELQTL